jgi:hypothetical protein
MSAPESSPRVLRPRLRRRVPFFVVSVLLFALSVTALFFSPVVGAVGVALFGFAVANATLRLFHPRSYATELDDEGFRTFGATGRPAHRVRWAEVAHLTVFHGNGMGGPGTLLLLAWRCEPRRPGDGRQPWVRGGRNFAGEEFDGALPDPYLGIEQMLELFKRRADAAHEHEGRAGGADRSSPISRW